MANTKISEYSNIPANNTEIDGINIAEGCAPSGINNAIRELMAQLKDFQSGTAGDNLTVGGTLSVTGAVNLSTVLSVTNGGTGLDTLAAGDLIYGSASNTFSKLSGPSTTGNVLLSGAVAPSWGKMPLSTHVSGALPIANGGTGATTQTGAINALLPSQTGNANKLLQTDGTNVSWATVAAGSSGTVTSITAGNGLSGGTITTTGTISMGTPGTLSATSSNSASGSTHTHAVTFPVTSLKGQSSDTAQTGSIILTNLESFAKSLGANGYQKLPGGLIIQWGTGTITGNTSTTANLLLTYDTAHVAAVGSFNSTNVSQGDNCYLFPSSNSQITITNGIADTLTYWYISLGY
jgi:hypothetical protein